MDKSSIPAILPQHVLQMLANAADGNAFLCKQHDFIIHQVFDKFFCKGIYLYKLQRITFDRIFIQTPLRFDQFGHFIRITHQDD